MAGAGGLVVPEVVAGLVGSVLVDLGGVIVLPLGVGVGVAVIIVVTLLVTVAVMLATVTVVVVAATVSVVVAGVQASPPLPVVPCVATKPTRVDRMIRALKVFIFCDDPGVKCRKERLVKL